MARPPLELETWGKIRRTTAAGQPAAVCRYRDSDGVTRIMQRSGRTPAEAERNLVKALKKRLAPSADDLTGNSTVRAAAGKWFAEPERDDLAVATRDRYRRVLDTIIGKGFGDVRLAEATVPRVDRFLKRVTAENGPGTAKTTRTLLQHVFALAVRHGAMRSNPVRDAGRIVQAKKPVTAPSVADVRAMRWIMWAYDITPDKRGATRSADLGDLFDVFIGTGARTAEVLALRWSDVDLESSPATVSIRGTVIIGDDGKASALFTGTGCLNGGIKSQQIGLIGNAANDIDHYVDLGGFTLQFGHQRASLLNLFRHTGDRHQRTLHILITFAG